MIRDGDDEDLDPIFSLIKRELMVAQSQSDVLAAYVVSFRAIGIGENFAILCMEELVRRRSLGEEFDFEDWIETELAKIPKIAKIDITNMTLNLQDMLSAFVSEQQNAK